MTTVKLDINPGLLYNEMHSDEIKRELRNEGYREVYSDIIGTKILGKLFQIDEVVYVRFVSVFYRYHNIEVLKKSNKNYFIYARQTFRRAIMDSF